MIRRFVRKTFPSASAVKSTAAAPRAPLPTASEPPAAAAAAAFHLTKIQLQPTGRLLTIIAVFNIRYMLPGIATGAGGGLERTMGFELLHDAEEDVFMVYVQTTNSFLQLKNVGESSIKDLVATFFRNKPLSSTMTNLDQRLEALKEKCHFICCDLRAY